MQSQWQKILQNQSIEKKHYEDQLHKEQQERKQRYKQELETDMQLHKQQKRAQAQQNNQLESVMLETLRQRESQKLKEIEERKIKQIQTSLDNLNNLMIKKKMHMERSYQEQKREQEQINNQLIKQVQLDENHKLQKNEEAKILKQTYDDMINLKRSKHNTLPQMTAILPQSNHQKIDSKHYKDELQKQMEDKQRQYLEIKEKKQEERAKVERKIEFEKQKLIENKMRDFQTYKQYEAENYELLQHRKNVTQVPEMPKNDKLPKIYLDNYQPIERKRQLDLLDRDLLRYQQLQKQKVDATSPSQRSNVQTLPTPSQKSRTSSQQVVVMNNRFVPKKRSYNIVTGMIN